MGIEKCCIKSGSVPSFPGKTKSNKDHNSFRLFWMGDPDKMIRWGVRNCKQKAKLSMFSDSTKRGAHFHQTKKSKITQDNNMRVNSSSIKNVAIIKTAMLNLGVRMHQRLLHIIFVTQWYIHDVPASSHTPVYTPGWLEHLGSGFCGPRLGPRSASHKGEPCPGGSLGWRRKWWAHLCPLQYSWSSPPKKNHNADSKSLLLLQKCEC